MSKYKLIAADMDGTALTSEKVLTERTAAAMEKAIAQGKHVLFSTGRSVSLIRPYVEQVRGMEYAITGSGASVLNLKTGEKYLYKTIDEETVKRIIAEASGRYVMPIIFKHDETFGSEWCVDNCSDFGFSAYEQVYRDCMHIVPDAMNEFMENPAPVEKFNLFFADDYEADEVYEKIKELPISFTCHTKTGLEINAVGVSKAEGLKVICARLGIDLSECIAIGDSENDEEVLAVAGLKVAMANATDRVKVIADIVTADCDHDGVASIIEDYLLD